MSSSEQPLNLARWIAPADASAFDALVLKTLKGRPLSALTRSVDHTVSMPAVLTDPVDAVPYGRAGQWSRRQEVRSTFIKRASRAVAEDRSGGGDSPWIRVDRPTSLGVRPDHFRADSHNPGLAILGRDDLAGVLRSTDLAHDAVVLEAGANALGLYAALLAVADERGTPRRALRGCVQGDPLGALMTTGLLPRGVDAAFDDLAAVVGFAGLNTPELRVVSLGTLAVHEAGASAVQELAVALASLVETGRALDARGLSMTSWLPQAELVVGIGGNLLLELAKIRAARRLWSRLVAHCGAPATPVYIHGRMADAIVARRDPWSNLLRATQAGFVGATGGVDALTLLPHDYAQGPSSPTSRRIVRNLQVLLAEESHLSRVEDPAAGSHTIEFLTNALCEQAWQRFVEIERSGGLLAVLGDGSLLQDIHAHRETRTKDLRTRRQPITGVSRYIGPPEGDPTAPEDLQAYNRRLQSRWNAACMAQESKVSHPDAQAALTTLRQGGTGRVAAAIVAARHGVVLADIAGARPGMSFHADAFQPRRDAEEWEALAAAVADKKTASTVFLGNIGPVINHQARAGFARDLFRAGGFDLIDNDGFTDPDELVSAFGDSGCEVVCLCGQDSDYERVIPMVGKALMAAGARAIIVAGRWPDHRSFWGDAGVTDVVYTGADVLDVLVRLAQTMEVSP